MRRLATIEDFVVGTIFYSEIGSFLRVNKVEKVNGIPSVIRYDNPATFDHVSSVIGKHKVEYTPSTMSDLVLQAQDAVSDGEIKSFEFIKSQAGGDLLIIRLHDDSEERITTKTLDKGFRLFKPNRIDIFTVNHKEDVFRISQKNAVAVLSNGEEISLNLLDERYPTEYIYKLLKGATITQEVKNA